MSILDRKPKHYSTSDLFWEPTAAPTDGTVGDINTMKLAPSHLGLAQDVIVDTSGVLRNRGAIKTITSDTFTTLCPMGVVQTQGGTALMIVDNSSTAFLYGTAAAALTGFSKLTASGVGFASANQLCTSQGIVWNTTKLVDDKGAILCGQPGYQSTITLSASLLWGGNAVTTNDTIAGTAASTLGSKSIAGVGTAWTSALVNCFLFINSQLVGQVDQVTSTTTILLKKGAYATVAAAAPAFKTTRTLINTVYKGRITTTTGSAVVVGANTKWNNAGPAGSGSAYILSANTRMFRYSDGAFIGTILSVQNDTTLTLAANAAIAMTNEEYYIINIGGGIGTVPTNNFYAACAAQYADSYWYGGISAADNTIVAAAFNTFPFAAANSLTFTKKREPEFLDLDPANGDILALPTGDNPDSIKALYPTKIGLLVFRLYDVFIITGYSRETFKATKIAEDGAYSCRAMIPYGTGIVWAGLKSVWYFDGSSVVDLLQNKTRNFYQRTCRGTDIGQPVGVATSNDHILVSYLVDTNADRTWPYKNTTRSLQYCTMVINMLNGAVTFFTNLYVSGSFIPKPLTGTSKVVPVILARDTANTGGNGYLLNGEKIFRDSSTAADNFDDLARTATFTTGAAVGPDVQFETVKLSLGNAARLKFWKMVLFNYSSDVSMTATFISANDTTIDFPNRATGTAGVVTLPVSSNVGILKRIKFLIRSPALSIRVYQTSTASATSQRFKLFWYTVGGKWMRQGRQQ